MRSPGAAAWPAETMTALSRDARKLLPRSLSRLLGERETQVLDELRRFPPDVSQALAAGPARAGGCGPRPSPRSRRRPTG